MATSVSYRNLSKKARFVLKRTDGELAAWLHRWPGASGETRETGDWTGMPERAFRVGWAAAKNIQRLLAGRGVTVDLEPECVDDGEPS
jgi:hypothetical protein